MPSRSASTDAVSSGRGALVRAGRFRRFERGLAMLEESGLSVRLSSDRSPTMLRPLRLLDAVRRCSLAVEIVDSVSALAVRPQALKAAVASQLAYRVLHAAGVD